MKCILTCMSDKYCKPMRQNITAISAFNTNIFLPILVRLSGCVVLFFHKGKYLARNDRNSPITVGLRITNFSVASTYLLCLSNSTIKFSGRLQRKRIDKLNLKSLCFCYSIILIVNISNFILFCTDGLLCT